MARGRHSKGDRGTPLHDDMCDSWFVDQQRQQLRKTVEWARRIREELQPVLDKHGDRVHFRPSSGGVTMVGLLPSRPQRGRSGVRNLRSLVERFDDEFNSHCRDIDQGRPTPEKALQSFLIREAQANQRRRASLNASSAATGDPVELLFVTDEIALPDDTGGKLVCDLLALRVDGSRARPVVIELKSAREMTRLVKQVTAYANVVDRHADLFGDLYCALLGRAVVFDGLCERWIVWPQAGPGADPREAELASRRIRVVGYAAAGGAFALRVGEAP